MVAAAVLTLVTACGTEVVHARAHPFSAGHHVLNPVSPPAGTADLLQSGCSQLVSEPDTTNMLEFRDIFADQGGGGEEWETALAPGRCGGIAGPVDCQQSFPWYDAAVIGSALGSQGVTDLKQVTFSADNSSGTVIETRLEFHPDASSVIAVDAQRCGSVAGIDGDRTLFTRVVRTGVYEYVDVSETVAVGVVFVNMPISADERAGIVGLADTRGQN
jgi:hypothetical protein